jgi:hypothetical protein
MSIIVSCQCSLCFSTLDLGAGVVIVIVAPGNGAAFPEACGAAILATMSEFSIEAGVVEPGCRIEPKNVF